MIGLHLLEDLDDETAAFLDPAADYAPRLVAGSRLDVARPALGAAAIVVEHTAPGSTDAPTVYAADIPQHRNPAFWRGLLGPGRLRLWSHPSGVDDAQGMASRASLGTFAADDEAPDVTRFDAAPRKATVTVAGVVADVTLAACPGGVPHYVAADVCPLARLVRDARRAKAVRP